MLVPMRAILEAADKHRYGQGAFNMNSVGQVEAAIRIHELLDSAAILQGAEASNAYLGGAAWRTSRKAPRSWVTPSGNTAPKAPSPWRCTWTTADRWKASRPASRAATPAS